MPNTIRTAIWLYAMSVVIPVLLSPSIFTIALASPILAFQGVLLYKIGTRRNWARIALLTFAALTLSRALYSFGWAPLIASRESLLGNWLGTALLALPSLLKVISLVLLFSSSARDWFKAGDWRSIAAGLATSLLVLGTVHFVSHGLGGPSSEPGLSADGLKRSDPKYPVATASPTHSVALIVSGYELPDHLRFTAEYESSCRYQIAATGGSATYSVSVPIEMIRSQVEYRGSVIIDKFQPGPCEWHLDSVTYGFRSEDSLGTITVEQPGVVTRYDADAASDVATTPRIDLWCYRVPEKFSKISPLCESLPNLKDPNAVRRVSAEFLSKFTLDQQVDRSPPPMNMDNTREIHVQLHDLNSIPGALLPPGAGN